MLPQKKYGTGMAAHVSERHLDIHLELERKLANFMHKEEAIVFSPVSPSMRVCLDASPAATTISSGMNVTMPPLSKGYVPLSPKYKFRHNDMASLEKQLKRCDLAR